MEIPIIIAAAILCLLAVLVVRTMAAKPDMSGNPQTIDVYPDPNLAATHLQEAIRFRTVSNADQEKTDWQEFIRMQEWMEKTYPLIHEKLDKVMINTYTPIFKWEGTDPKLDPILLMAHQDVVPEGDPDKWEHGAFSGDICENGYLWGRGAIDIKIQMVSILEAVEFQLGRDYTPKRGIYICFGHDEEIGGAHGAFAAAAYLKEKGVRFSFLLDEGGAITEKVIDGLNRPLAAVGVGEKGYLDIELSCVQKGGHSSQPPARTAVGKVAKAVSRLEKRQFPVTLTAIPRLLFKTLAPYMPFSRKLVLANLWLFKPLFLKVMTRNATSNAMVRTTTAATMASGSDAPNVLASTAHTTVNLRLMTGTSSGQAIERIKKVIADDSIEVKKLLVNEPSRISPTNDKPFQVITKTIKQIFPDAVPAPYLMLGGTDAIKYQEVCNHIYRFSPLYLPPEELETVHSFNERLSLENIDKCMLFFTQLLENLENEL